MKNLLYLMPLCMLTVFGMHAQTPPWNGNLTVLGFTDMTQATFVKPWTIVTTDPGGACANAAAVEYNSTDHELFSCDGGTWTAISGSGVGGGYVTIQSNGGGLTQRSVMNFNAPIQAFDNAAATRTDISLPQASSISNGYLSTADWTTFNNKQVAGNYLTDPGANGLVFRTNVNTTRPATSADIDSLLTNVNFNTTGTGIGPVAFVPNTADTLRVFDATASTGVTSLNLQEGAAQNTASIVQVLDNAGNLLGRLAFTNAFPYWLLVAPTNINDFKSFGAQAAGDFTARVAMGLDGAASGAGFINWSDGSSLTAADIGLERSAPVTLEVTAGQGIGTRGNLLVGNINISGTCTGAGCVSAGVSSVTASAPLASSGGSTPNLSIPTGNKTGTGAKLATSTGSLVSNDCAKWDASGNIIDAGAACGSGGPGGASLATQLLDFAPGSITATAIPFGASCAGATPCFINLGGTQFSFPNGVTLNLTGGTDTDTIFYYVDGSGNRTIGFSSLTNTYTCTGCEVAPVGSTTAFPATSYPLYSCTVTAGSFTSCVDHRPILASTPVQNGLGTSISQSGAVKQFDITEKPRHVTGTSDSLANTDCGGMVTYNNASAVAVALPQAGLGSQFLNGCAIEVHNYGAGTVTITPSGSTINNGATTYTLATGAGARIASNGTNYDIGVGSGGGGSFNGGTITNALTVNTTASGTAGEIELTSPSSLAGIGITGNTQPGWLIDNPNTTGNLNFFDRSNSVTELTIAKGTGNMIAAGTMQAASVRTTGNLIVNINNVTFAATPVFDASKGDQSITLTGNVTSSTITNLLAGTRINFQICQDATGSRTFAWPSNVHGAMTIGTTASKCNVQSFESFDGSFVQALGPGVINQ